MSDNRKSTFWTYYGAHAAPNAPLLIHFDGLFAKQKGIHLTSLDTGPAGHTELRINTVDCFLDKPRQA